MAIYYIHVLIVIRIPVNIFQLYKMIEPIDYTNEFLLFIRMHLIFALFIFILSEILSSIEQ